ncbi:MAG: SpoIIE family protein phosphatase, partial [Bacteroidales bacterium]|nr:SpoIIE family protein phosphatase [Bacteroidales bacterium]
MKLKEEEMKELTIKQLTLQLEKEAREKDLLRTEKEVEQLEKEKLQQSLKITRQQHEAEQRKKETRLLEQQNRIKDLKLEQEERIQREQEGEIELLERQKQLDQLKIEKQETARKTLLGTIVLVIAIAMVILISLLLTRKKNILLAKQKIEIEDKNIDLEQKNIEISSQRDEIEIQHNQLIEQNEEIEQINQEITKSIEYAERIQVSALPDKLILEKNYDDFFIFFRPRDIVSGDFYWFATIENQTVITVADCTGHGVPGAFMSMLGMSLLNEIVVKGYVTHPGVILRKLRKEIINALNQRGISGEQRDGMDMALISLDNKTQTVQFAGAYNPLYILREKKRATSKILKDFIALEGKTHTLYEIKG